MKKTLTIISSAVLALAIAIPGIAGSQLAKKASGRSPEKAAVTLKAAEKPAKGIMFEGATCRTAKASSNLRQSMSNLPLKMRTATPSKAMQENLNLPMIYGAVSFNTVVSTTGLYEVNTPATENLFDGPNATYGGIYVDGVYYTTTYQNILGIIIVTECNAYDVETGEQIGNFAIDLDGVAPAGYTLDPTTGDVYGITYNTEGSGLQLSKAEFSTTGLTITKIADMPGNWNTIACDKNGQLYGISYDWNGSTATASYLNKINKANGELTIVGETGQLPQYLSGSIIDPKSSRMFWNVCPPDETGWLCEVNLETGVATQLFKYEADDEICGMYIPYMAEDGAPATVENLQASFEEGSMSGTVSFNAPTTLFDGTAATGDITYTILANGEEVKSGTTQYGASVSESLTFEEAGDYTFVVTVSNEVGPSPKAKVTTFVGFGTPATPNASLTYTDGNFDLSWEEVTTSADGGYLNPANITYTVTRYPGAVVVADGITATSFSEPIAEPEAITSYYYTVVAKADGVKSAVAVSNTIVLGSIIPPYSNSFDAARDIEGYTVIDNNADSRTWTWEAGSVKIQYNGSKDMDDYLITPPMKLEAGKAYKISFRAWNNSTSYIERVEAKIGMQPTVEGLDNLIIAPTDITGGPTAAQTYEASFVPKVSGTYYLGIHGVSKADQYFLFVDDITISAPSAATVPNVVTDVVITASETGALQTNVSFKAPAVDLAGDALSEITKIEVRRGGELVKLFMNPAVGSDLSFVDYPSQGGDITYEFQAFNADGEGETLSDTVFVGFDVPTAPTDVNIEEIGNSGKVTISWAPVTEDVNGKPLSGLKVSYTIQDVNDKTIIAENIHTSSYTFQAFEPKEDDEQDFVQYAVFAVTEEGNAGAYTDMIAVGQPYPGMYESFPDGSLNYILGLTYPSSSNQAQVGLYTDEIGIASQDGDNGMLGINAQYVDYTAIVFTGKISLADAETPGFSFYTYNIGGDDTNELQLFAREVGESTWTPLGEAFAINSLSDEEGWLKVSASLAAYAGKDVEVSFQGTIKKYAYILIDNITVGNLPAQDLSLSAINAPSSVNAGESYTVSVSVVNDGMEASTADAVVELYADGKLVDSKALESLESAEKVTVEFERAFGAVDTETVVYYAEVVYAADEDLDNNTSKEISVKPKFSNLPKVKDLAAEKADGGVKLTWSEPDLSKTSEEKFIDFEDATAWDTTYDGWTFIDLDNSPIGGFQGMNLPGIEPGQTTGSFFVFDVPSSGGNQTFDAHSGNIYIASLFRYDDGMVDDWAISPELDGYAQTISFWAKSYSGQYPETIEMLYSTGSTNPEDFVKVAEQKNLPAEWTEYKFEVPEGAKHFAIRSCATSSFMLMLDDFTFSVASTSANLSIVGYDVYRDGVKITAEPTAETEYVDTEAGDGEHSYVVVVVYDKGTSAPSNVATIELSGVASLNGALAVKAGKGNIAVSGAEGELVTIAAADGKVVYNSVADGKVSVDVPAGVYVVKAGKKATKVVVK